MSDQTFIEMAAYEQMQTQRDRAVAALRMIAEHPTEQRNPDGDEQAAWSMQFIAHEALAELEES